MRTIKIDKKRSIPFTLTMHLQNWKKSYLGFIDHKFKNKGSKIEIGFQLKQEQALNSLKILLSTFFMLKILSHFTLLRRVFQKIVFAKNRRESQTQKILSKKLYMIASIATSQKQVSMMRRTSPTLWETTKKVASQVSRLQAIATMTETFHCGIN